MTKDEVLHWIIEASQCWGPGTDDSEQIHDAVADLYARLARVEALADEWESALPEPGPGFDAVDSTIWSAAKQVRQALKGE